MYAPPAREPTHTAAMRDVVGGHIHDKSTALAAVGDGPADGCDLAATAERARRGLNLRYGDLPWGSLAVLRYLDDPEIGSALQRAVRLGAENLTDCEVIALLLELTVPAQRVRPLVRELIEEFGGVGSILAADPARLRRFDELCPLSIGVLKLVHMAMQCALREHLRDRPLVPSSAALLDYLGMAMAHETAEQLRVLYLNGKNRLILDEVVGRGTVDHTPLYPREVVRRALEVGAASVVLAHNHPSGDPTPSRADIETTRRVHAALAAVDITLLDHIVVGRGHHVGFRERRLLPGA